MTSRAADAEPRLVGGWGGGGGGVVWLAVVPLIYSAAVGPGGRCGAPGDSINRSARRWGPEPKPSSPGQPLLRGGGSRRREGRGNRGRGSRPRRRPCPPCSRARP